MPRLTILSAASLLLLLPAAASAQDMPACTGDDAAGASAEFDAGNALMQQALGEARSRHIDRARALAGQALEHFDRQCELGDAGALAERGAALMLMGEALRSAQSYDAYLQLHPLDGLDARTRRRIESNLQPGTLTVDADGAARLFVDDLDFGALPRSGAIRLPFGEHRVEARTEAGTVIASAPASLSSEAASASVRLVIPGQASIAGPDQPPPERADPPPARVDQPPSTIDFAPWYATTAAVALVGVGLGIGFLVAADERARTFNETCATGMALGCDSVLSERESFLGASVFGFVLGGLGVVGLVTVIALDAGQPRDRLRIAWRGTSVSLDLRF